MDARADVKRVIPNVRLDLSVPEHSEIWAAYRNVAGTARAEWVRMTLVAGLRSRGERRPQSPSSERVSVSAPAKEIKKQPAATSRLSGAFSSNGAS